MPSYETTAVVYLDVLGTKERKTFDEKFTVHRLFHPELKRNAARQEQSPHVIYKRELRSFSDCVYIFYNYKEAIEESRKDNLNLLYICLYNTSISILRILSAGFLVRGGASLGDCFIDKLGFFGPAIEEAYCIETKLAKFPRVMLSDELGSRLSEWEQNRESGDFVSSMFKSIPKLVTRDDDGHFFLNVFFALETTGVLQFGDQKLELQELKDQICKTALSMQTKYKDDENIKGKHEWMKNFADKSNIKLNPSVVSGAGTIVLDP
jgi:hypothetical protein